MKPCGKCKFAAICFAVGDDKMKLLWDAFETLYVKDPKGRKARKEAKASQAYMDTRPAACPARSH